MDIASTTSIARPAAEVFAFVADVRNDPKWHTDILEATLTDDRPVGAGSTFAIKFKPFMGQSEGTTTVASYEPPHRVVMTGRMGKMAPTITLTVEPEGAESRFTRAAPDHGPIHGRVDAQAQRGLPGEPQAGAREPRRLTLYSPRPRTVRCRRSGPRVRRREPDDASSAVTF